MEANFETREVVTGSLRMLVQKVAESKRVVARRKAVLVREFSEGGSWVSRQRSGCSVANLFTTKRAAQRRQL